MKLPVLDIDTTYPKLEEALAALNRIDSRINQLNEAEIPAAAATLTTARRHHADALVGASSVVDSEIVDLLVGHDGPVSDSVMSPDTAADRLKELRADLTRHQRARAAQAGIVQRLRGEASKAVLERHRKMRSGIEKRMREHAIALRAALLEDQAFVDAFEQNQLPNPLPQRDFSFETLTFQLARALGEPVA